MKRRGRTPAPSDAAAVTAQTAVGEYLRKNSLNVAQLAKLTRCSEPAIWSALRRNPAAWSPTLTKLNEFLKAQNIEQSQGADRIAERLAAAARGTPDSSIATAKLLRMVADLLDSSSAKDGGPVSR